MDPKDIDVNIHPTKTEIKFENEQAIWQIVLAAVKDAVGRFNNVSTIDFDTEGKPDIPVFNPNNHAEAPKVEYNPTYNPFDSMQAPCSYSSKDPKPSKGDADQIIRSHIPSQWEQLYDDLDTEGERQHDTLFPETATETADSLIAEKSPAHYQYKGQYIMTAVKSGLMVVDQHRAHIRILFDHYQKQLATRAVHAQKMLFPDTIQLSVQEDTLYQTIAEEVSAMGFELANLGGGTYAINAMPEGLEGVDVLCLLHNMLQSVQDRGVAANQEVYDTIALSMARAAAIPYGQVLSNDEMENIINNLFVCSNVNYTPDGKRVLYILKQNDIEQMLR